MPQRKKTLKNVGKSLECPALNSVSDPSKYLPKKIRKAMTSLTPKAKLYLQFANNNKAFVGRLENGLYLRVQSTMHMQNKKQKSVKICMQPGLDPIGGFYYFVAYRKLENSPVYFALSLLDMDSAHECLREAFAIDKNNIVAAGEIIIQHARDPLIPNTVSSKLYQIAAITLQSGSFSDAVYEKNGTTRGAADADKIVLRQVGLPVDEHNVIVPVKAMETLRLSGWLDSIVKRGKFIPQADEKVDVSLSKKDEQAAINLSKIVHESIYLEAMPRRESFKELRRLNSAPKRIGMFFQSSKNNNSIKVVDAKQNQPVTLLPEGVERSDQEDAPRGFLGFLRCCLFSKRKQDARKNKSSNTQPANSTLS